MESEFPREPVDLLSEIKTKRSFFQFEINKAKRDNDIAMKRTRNFLNNVLEREEFKSIIDMMNSFATELKESEKLKANQIKNGKNMFLKLRKLYQENKSIFKEIIQTDVFINLSSKLLNSSKYTSDIKHEVLWIISLASSCTLNTECATTLIKTTISSLKYLNSIFPKANILIFYQKIAYTITNLIIEDPKLVAYFPEDHLMQLLILTLIDSSDLEYILTGMWLLRTLCVKNYTDIPNILSNFSIQKTLLHIMKINAQNKSMLQEIVWTLAYLTQIIYDYEVINSEFLEIVVDCGLYFEEFLLPCITIIGNSLQFLDDSTIQTIISNSKFQDFVKSSLDSKNFLAKREIIFTITNLCLKSEGITKDIIQKNDLIDHFLDLVLKKETYVSQEALNILSIVCTVQNGCYMEYLSINHKEKLIELNQILEAKNNSSGLQTIFETNLYNILNV